MSDYETSNFAAHAYNLLTGSNGQPGTVITTDHHTQYTIDVAKELAFQQGYDRAIKDVMEIINKQQEINDKLGRIGGEDLHIIRIKIKEMYL
jgi:GGDEF domain-containing protein